MHLIVYDEFNNKTDTHYCEHQSPMAPHIVQVTNLISSHQRCHSAFIRVKKLVRKQREVLLNPKHFSFDKKVV